MRDIAVFPVDRLALRLEPQPWAFAVERRAEIDSFFAAARREKPALWNGRVLILRRQRLSGGVFEGTFLETDYASFSAWIAWGRPHAGVHDCFGAAAVKTRDGAFLLGVMAAHTFNAGNIYFPCGTPDTADVEGGMVDLDASLRRELKEETGLDAGDLDAEQGWSAVIDGGCIALIKVLHADDSANDLRARVEGHCACARQPELADIRMVRSAADFDPSMPRYVTAFLTRQFSGV
jgi:8-oxo-dGTP pyrophosphatase MutT (NUDIX family)